MPPNVTVRKARSGGYFDTASHACIVLPCLETRLPYPLSHLITMKAAMDRHRSRRWAQRVS